MNGFGRAYQELMLEAKVSQNKINLAMDKHKLVVIRYNTHGEWIAIADRLCGVFAYGVTKAGNECIRVFEYQGDTSTFVPAWKLIRLDRIISWHETNKTISEPPDNYGVGLFNPNGDDSMSIVYKVAKFEGFETPLPQGNEPKTVDNVKTGVSKQQSQKQRSEQQKTEDGLKPYQGTQDTTSNEPKMAQDVKGTERYGLEPQYADKPTMKTDTERAIDYLKRQLEKPEKIDLSKFSKKTKPQEENPKNAPTNTQRTGLEPQYSNKPTKKTDTETALDYLRKQLENPEKIDLDKIPKK